MSNIGAGVAGSALSRMPVQDMPRAILANRVDQLNKAVSDIRMVRARIAEAAHRLNHAEGPVMHPPPAPANTVQPVVSTIADQLQAVASELEAEIGWLTNIATHLDATV